MPGSKQSGWTWRADIGSSLSDRLAEEVSNRALHEQNKDSLPPAVILAGGLGTRLRRVYSAGPKSMAPVGGRPFLDYLLTLLRDEGVREVILCVGYKRMPIQKFVGTGRKWGLRATFSIESKPLGTGGAVKQAERLISGEKLLVINGDTFLNVSLRELLRFHKDRKSAATIATVKVANSGRYGSLRIDGKGRITAFLEKEEGAGRDKSKARKGLINGGVYVFEKTLLKAIPLQGAISMEREVFPPLLATKKLYAFESGAYFLDIGVPKELRRAQHELPKRISIGHPR